MAEPDTDVEKTISKWNPNDFEGLVSFLRANWKWPERAQFLEDGSVFYLSTGGWSDHEYMIRFIPAKWMDQFLVRWKTGGHYWFRG